jgi:hypothetical protein
MPDIKADLLAQVFPWRPISERPPIMEQPGFQFIVIQGSRFHSGAHWARQWRGLATIRTPGSDDELLQYLRSDVERICRDGDIDLDTAVVTHWMPAVFTPLPEPVRDLKAAAEGNINV